MKFAQGDNPIRSKTANQSAILRMIYHQGPIKRPDIADQLGLTRPTITTTVKTMIEKGLVSEVDLKKANDPTETVAPGRRAYPVDIVPHSNYFVGVEMRGGCRALCITDYRGNVVYRDVDNTIHQDYAQNINQTGSMILRALNKSGVPRSKIAGIGFCVPGLVDNNSGFLKIHPGYNWRNKNLRNDIRERISYDGPITISNNACARAQAAQLFEHDHPIGDTFAYLFISTGIACPMMLNDSTNYGSVVGLGEVGHIVMNPHGPKCICGNHGCLEAYSSDYAILKSCQAALLQEDAPVLAKYCTAETVTMEHVLQAQQENDPTVEKIVKAAIDPLGIGIANICNFACPETLFIEGMLFLEDRNKHHFLELVKRNLYDATNAHTDIIFLKPDPFSGAVGAAAVAIAYNLKNYQE